VVRKLVRHGKCLRRSLLLWYVTQSRLVVSYGRRVRVKVIQMPSCSKAVLVNLMGPIGYPETSVSNHQSVPRNVPEERISHLQVVGSLNSRASGEVFEV
jgi:hypothetical protein